MEVHVIRDRHQPGESRHRKGSNVHWEDKARAKPGMTRSGIPCVARQKQNPPGLERFPARFVGDLPGKELICFNLQATVMKRNFWRGSCLETTYFMSEHL